MLTINDKIELKRECIDIPQAIKSGYNIVEVDRERFSWHVSIKYDVFSRYEGVTVIKDIRGAYFTFQVRLYGMPANKYFKQYYVKFIINMQEYGKQ